MELGEERSHAFGAGVHEARDGRRSGDGTDASGAFDNDFFERALSSDDVLEVVFGGDAEDDVEVGQLQVGIKEDHSLTGSLERGG